MKSEQDYFKKTLDDMSKDAQKRHSEKMNEVNFCIMFDGEFPEDPKKRSEEIFSKYYMGVDIQDGKTSVAVSPFKFEKVPHLSDYLDMDFNIKETVTIMKGVSLGATTCISDNYFEIINRHEREQNQKKLDLAMEDLKSKYPDWRNI